MKLSKAEIATIIITVLFIAFAIASFGKGSAASSDVTVSVSFSEPPSETSASSDDASVSPLVNINTANAQELCALPGIGEKIAARIISYREEHGLFASKDEIMSVSGIGSSIYEDIKNQITTG